MAYTKFISEINLSKTFRVETANLLNLDSGELGHAMSLSGWFQSKFHGMMDVLATSNVFKVGCSVICPDAILMIDREPFWPWSNKCFSNKTMYQDSPSLRAVCEADSKVTTSTKARFHDVTNTSPMMPNSTGSFDSTLIRYRIGPPGDWLPMFHVSII